MDFDEAMDYVDNEYDPDYYRDFEEYFSLIEKKLGRSLTEKEREMAAYNLDVRRDDW